VAYVAGKVGLGFGDSGFNIRADVDGDGSVTLADVNLVNAKVGSVLPPRDPTAPPTIGYTNLVFAVDVNDSGTVTPPDALLIIDDLILFGSHKLPAVAPGTQLPPPYRDVSGDGKISLLDALRVINRLLAHPNGSQGAAQTAALGDPIAGALVVSFTPADEEPSATSAFPIAFSIIVSGDVSRVTGDSAATQAAVPVTHSLDDGPTVALRTAGARRAGSTTTLAEAMSDSDIGSEPARARQRRLSIKCWTN
jgi:hypothetical protein